ncbi:MAG: hypothetical protein LUD48_02795 [Prevotella sp.]|nr:hypothetical protein [Prevotella sp.]
MTHKTCHLSGWQVSSQQPALSVNRYSQPFQSTLTLSSHNNDNLTMTVCYQQ